MDQLKQVVSYTCIVTALLISVSGAKAEASTPHSFYKAVSTEAVGQPYARFDSARPAADTPFNITIALTSNTKSDIADYVASLSDPNSPNYHKWITPAEFGQKFGASDKNIGEIVRYLSKEGLSGITVWPDHLFVSAEGSRSTVESAFGVTINGYARTQYDIDRGLSPTYYAPDQEPSVDVSIAGELSGVFGLSSSGERVPAVRKPLAVAMTTGTNGSLLPSNVAQAYNISPLHSAGLNGQGETIAIFSPTAYLASDISTFLANNDFPTGNIHVINVDGGTTDLSGEDEACIDIESVVGQAPDATVNVYEGPNTGSNFDIFEKIETDRPNVLSESWGTYEDQVNSSYADSYETIREAMAAEGVTIFVASGDSGAYDPATGQVSCSVDATSDYVTAVGGTELTLSGGNWSNEVAWSYNDGTTTGKSGSGGGLSVYFPEPSWQTGPGVSNHNSNGFRQVPDVSAAASKPYYDIYVDGSYHEFGGTSCSTPLWASAMTLIEQNLQTRLGNVDPNLYSFGTNSPSVYHDITSGNDGVYDCTTGWDFVSGWGSANFYSLLTAFGGVLPTITSFTPSAGLSGTTVTITGTNLANVTSVTFGGVAATSFSNVSGTQVAAVVPSGAVTGTIAVNTPQGTATSSGIFTVSSMATVPTPSIAPPGGSFVAPQTVTISDSLSGATIYYTVNGTVPTSSSTHYTGPFTISSSETISAVAVYSGDINSAVSTAVFSIGQPAPTPTISPNSGTFTTTQSVTLADSLSGAVIYYTTNGTVPTTSSARYTSAISVSSSETIEAIATGTGYTTSLPASATFTITPPAPAPSISPDGGSFTGSTTATLSDTLSGAAIYYTTDGSTPTTSSTLYSSPFTVTTSETINAIAVDSGYSPSSVTSAAFTVTQGVPVPVINPTAGTFTSAQSVTITDSMSGTTIYYTTNGSTPTTSSSQYSAPISVNSSETVEAMATKSQLTNSGVASAAYNIVQIVQTVPTPTVSPNGGTFTSEQTVTLSDSLAGATIYYTTNGSTPTTSSTVYTAPFTLSANTTINAIAVAANYTNSESVSAAFTITIPVIASYSAGLQMISLPYSYPGVGLSSIFGYSGVTLAVWDPTSFAYAVTPTAPADEITAGQGYWVRFPQAVSVTLTGTPAPTNAPFTITLQPGWNMIGDPFTSSVALSNVTFDDGAYTFATATQSTFPIIGSSVYGYDQGSNSYTVASSLQPGQGYWIYASNSATMSIPAP